MLQPLLDKDRLFRFLLENSLFTKAQFDAYCIVSFLRPEGRSMREMVKVKDGGEVSKGSFARTLGQAKTKACRSLYSVLLMEYVGLIAKESVSGLLKAGELLFEIRSTGATIRQEEIESLLRTVIDRVMSGA